jgi:hypothetical protein
MKPAFAAVVAILFLGGARADWQLVREDGCYLHEEQAGISLYASRGIRGAPDRWLMRWVLDGSWGIRREKRGYRQVIPLRLSDGSRVDARVRWDEQGRAMLLIPDLDRAFRESQWASLGAEQIGLGGADEAWHRLLSCMGESDASPRNDTDSAVGWVLVDGHIGPGWAQRQIHLITAAMPLQGVVLSSDGGRLAEAIQLARWIRGQKLATAVDGDCASACVLAFAGGADRYLGPGARIGLHQFSSLEGGSFSGGQCVTAETAGFLEEMGVDGDLALLGAKISADDMHWLTPDEAMSHRLATMQLDQALDVR